MSKVDMTPASSELAERHELAAQFYRNMVAEYFEWERDKRPASQLSVQEVRHPSTPKPEGGLDPGEELTPWCPVEQTGHARPMCAYVPLDTYITRRLASASDEELASYGLVRETPYEEFAAKQAAEQEVHQARYDEIMTEYQGIMEAHAEAVEQARKEQEARMAELEEATPAQGKLESAP